MTSASDPIDRLPSDGRGPAEPGASGSVSHVRQSASLQHGGAQGQPEAPDPLIGTTLGHYAIQSRLGQGGMGTVYAAVQEPLGRPVALKLIHQAVAEEPKIAERFLREAKIAASLRNP